MRLAEKNKTKLYYALYSSNIKIVDANGDFTGGTTPGYESPIMFKGNIISKGGTTDIEDFGKAVDYDSVLELERDKYPFDVQTLIFETEPSLPIVKANADYTIDALGSSLNLTKYALKSV